MLERVARGLVVYPKTIEAAIMAELPFMVTEEILMAGVRGGGDRQALHESIRRHSMAAAEQVKLHGQPNDLLQRLAKEPLLANVNLEKVLSPASHTGRASQQVIEFENKVVTAIRQRYRNFFNGSATLSV